MRPCVGLKVLNIHRESTIHIQKLRGRECDKNFAELFRAAAFLFLVFSDAISCVYIINRLSLGAVCINTHIFLNMNEVYNETSRSNSRSESSRCCDAIMQTCVCVCVGLIINARRSLLCLYSMVN